MQTCPACDLSLPDLNQYCSNCGHRLAAPTPSTVNAIEKPSSGDCEWLYPAGAFISGLITFFSSWIYCTVTYGFLFGFGLGWIPSFILAAIVGSLWPLIALAVMAFVVFLMLSSK